MDLLGVSKRVFAGWRTRPIRKAMLPVCALLVFFGGLSTATGQAIFTEYTGTLTRLGMDNPGTLECLNGVPTGVPWYAGVPCSPADSRVRIRGVVLKYSQQTTDPRATGTLFVTVNANLDHWPGSGPMWGTARLEVSQGGLFEYVWTGERVLNTSETMRAVGHGIGGGVDGLRIDSEMSLLIGSRPPTYDTSGRLLQPPGK